MKLMALKSPPNLELFRRALGSYAARATVYRVDIRVRQIFV